MPIAPLSNYQNAVIDRYKSNDGTPDYEKSWSYLDKIVHREIVKAGGLLVFNAVLIAIAVAVGPWWSVICPVLASLVLPALAYATGSPRPAVIAAWPAAALILVKHQSNFMRLFAGTERRLGERDASGAPASGDARVRRVAALSRAPVGGSPSREEAGPGEHGEK